MEPFSIAVYSEGSGFSGSVRFNGREMWRDTKTHINMAAARSAAEEKIVDALSRLFTD